MIDINWIRDSHPLTEVVETYTGQQIVEHKIFAPWRAEKTASVHIYPDGKFWDYGAGFGGDVIDFLGLYFYGSSYQPDVHFHEIIDRLGALEIKQRPAPAVEKTVEQKKKPALTISLDQLVNFHDTMPVERRDYWRSRGLDDKTINAFMLGWDGRRYTIPLLYRLQPFGCKRRQSEIEDGFSEKYVMSKGSRAGIFNCDALYNAESCVICEGEIDAMLMAQLGYSAVSSTAGAGTWKADWAKLFGSVRNIFIVYDNDQAGRDGALKVKQSLRRAKIIELPESVKDVGEFWKTGIAAKWFQAELM